MIKFLILLNNIIQMFKTDKLNLEQAVKTIFGKNLQYSKAPSNQWQMFTPFSTKKNGSGSTILLKLIEVSSKLTISQQVAHKTKIKFNNLIHQVEFYQLQRNIDYTRYLLKAQKNLIPVSSYIQIKRKSDEKIQQKFILDFIQFSKKLESHPLSHKITFNADQIGLDQSNKFFLANYQAYFVPLEPQKQKKQGNLNQDIKRVLMQLLNPSQNQVNLAEIYSYVQQNYSQCMKELVQKCLDPHQFKTSQVLTTYNTENQHESVMETTLTESFNSSNVTVHNENFIDTSRETDIEQPLISKKSGKKKSKVGIFSVLFIIILLSLGAVTFKYLKPRPLLCLDSEYLDKQNNLCLSCDPSCDRCQANGLQSCLSCRQKFYLIKRQKIDRLGRCSVSCEGIRLNSYTCIANY